MLLTALTLTAPLSSTVSGVSGVLSISVLGGVSSSYRARPLHKSLCILSDGASLNHL